MDVRQRSTYHHCIYIKVYEKFCFQVLQRAAEDNPESVVVFRYTGFFTGPRGQCSEALIAADAYNVPKGRCRVLDAYHCSIIDPILYVWSKAIEDPHSAALLIDHASAADENRDHYPGPGFDPDAC